MKKYAVIESIGKWETMPNGKKRIYGTVEKTVILAESNDRDELIAKYGLFSQPIEYREGGTWHLIHGVEERKQARKMLK